MEQILRPRHGTHGFCPACGRWFLLDPEDRLMAMPVETLPERLVNQTGRAVHVRGIPGCPVDRVPLRTKPRGSRDKAKYLEILEGLQICVVV